MNLFGKTLGAEEISGLVFLLTALAFWSMVLVRERRTQQWFKSWEAGRKARRDAEITAEGGTPADRKSNGPWG